MIKIGDDNVMKGDDSIMKEKVIDICNNANNELKFIETSLLEVSKNDNSHNNIFKTYFLGKHVNKC